MMRQRSTTSILACFAVWLVGCAAPLAVPKLPTPASPFNTTTSGNTTVVAVAPPSQPCCPHQTLPEFLGVTQCVGVTQTRCAQGLACLGLLFPGLGSALEPKPPLLPITDPANLNSDNPTLQTAANVKASEDAAPQKIAALRYLATVGCGCYEGMDKAFLEAMKDCTEEVRYEAVLAIRATACSCEHGEKCSCGGCSFGSCCSAEIQKKLRELAYEIDDDGCPKEPSERVRRQARLALIQCPPATEPEPPKPQPGPTEGPKEAPPNETTPEDEPAQKPEEESGETTARSDEHQMDKTATRHSLINPAAGDMGAMPTSTVISDLSSETPSPAAALARPNFRLYGTRTGATGPALRAF